MSSVYERADAAIQSGEPIAIRLYVIAEPTEKLLEYITFELLQKYGKPDLVSPVYTSVKELAVNGTKANFKRVFFEKESIALENDEEYEKGIIAFKQCLNDRFIKDYARHGREKGLYVDVFFEHTDEALIIKVINNVPVSPKEDERIRDKFRKSMSYDDIAQFYMEMGDNSEGAGMGITLVTMMLKSSEIDPHGFTIYSNHVDHTVAKLEIPLTEHYIPARLRHKSSDKDKKS
jgi:hypothetical protein